jgi:hypothetical protein
MQHTHHSHLFFTHSSNPHNSSINHQSSINQSSTHPHIQSSPSSLFSQLNFDSSPFALALSQIQSQSLTHTPHPHTLTLTLSSLPQKHASPLLANLSLTLTHITLTSPTHHPLFLFPLTSFLAFPLPLSLSPSTQAFSPPLHFTPLLHSHTIPTIRPHSLTHLTSPLPRSLPSCARPCHLPPSRSLSSNQALSSHPLTLTLQNNTSSLCLALSPTLSSPASSSLSLSSSSWPHSPCQSRPPLLPQTSPLSSLSRPPLSLHLCPSNPTPVTPHTHRTPHLTNKPPQLTLPSTPHQHANLDCFVPSACTSSSSAVVLVVMLCCRHTRAHQAPATRAEPISALKPSARVR